jgi:opacity protein-like surface antigen
MKKFGLVVLFLLFSQVAFAVPNTGFYVGISGGYVIPQTMNVTDHDYSYIKMDTKLENGGFVGVKSGWMTPFTRRIMALEMEYNYIFGTNFDKDKIIYVNTLDGEGSGTLDGNIGIHALMFNMKARYPEGIIHPYAGFGLGYAFFQLDDITIRDTSGVVVDIVPGESGGGFCYQFLAGVDFDVAPNLSLGIGYKYFAALPTIGGEDRNLYADLDYRASIITVGLTFTF